MTKFMFLVKLNEAVLETIESNDQTAAIMGTVATAAAWNADIFKQSDRLTHPHDTDNPVVKAVMVIASGLRSGVPQDQLEELIEIERAWEFYLEKAIQGKGLLGSHEQ